jgi:hypothetical protein
VQNVWNQIAQMAGVAFHNTLAQNARMFAMLDTTLADGVSALRREVCLPPLASGHGHQRN